jgi:hypothetical protein
MMLITRINEKLPALHCAAPPGMGCQPLSLPDSFLAAPSLRGKAREPENNP